MVSGEFERIPLDTKELTEEQRESVDKLLEKLEEDDENEFWIGILIYAGFGDSTLHEDEADKWLKKSKENGNVTAEECLNDEKTKMKFVNKFIE